MNAWWKGMCVYISLQIKIYILNILYLILPFCGKH